MQESKLTPFGVCNNLARTPFKSQWGKYTFHFSSVKHKESFDSKLQVRIPWLNDSMSKRFKFEVDVSQIAVFQLYCQVETRGFYVVDEIRGLKWRDRESLTLSGLQANLRESSEKPETTTEG